MYAARQHKESTGRMLHQPEKKRTQLFRLEDNRGRKIAQETVKTLKTNVLQCVVGGYFSCLSRITKGYMSPILSDYGVLTLLDRQIN